MFLNAAKKGNNSELKRLIQKGVDVNAVDTEAYDTAMPQWGDKTTALILAAQKGHKDCLQTLLEEGADLECREDNDRTALMHAAKHGKTDCLKRLIE